ncbi:hypothetical protein O185_17495 [Photorhabdus temperata J3]|uniref:Uncharacterized protein n=1 Tax=Photorhabdus temperata J3 TaxID=1389415 RepID=U7QXK5_PHOTE|nr:hypothetical protein O185_17495 [Photorhabdus temperata J3]
MFPDEKSVANYVHQKIPRLMTSVLHGYRPDCEFCKAE